MDALILSCGTGGGHNAAGKAVMEELLGRNHHAVMMNPYTLHSDKLAEQIDRLYISAAKKAPGAFGAIYKAGELYRKLPFRSPVYQVNQKMVSVMQEYLEEHHFDIVIMPHLFPAEIMTNMKRRGIQIPKTLFIATDYCCIPFTEETDCDAYVIPSEELEEDFARRGIPLDRLYPYGIPVDSSFGTEMRYPEKSDAENAEAEDKDYILISGGSMGAGKIEKFVGLLLESMEREELKNDVNIIVVCGSNQELYRKLERRYGRQIIVIGHTDCMADYLRASRLYITKPGGLSSTEAAVSGIPLLHMPPIPGCETCNAQYFRNRNMSMTCKVTGEGAREVLALLDQEEFCRDMVKNQQRHIRRDGAIQICRLAERLVSDQEEQPEAILRFRMGTGV